jgi:hypothetical protein
MPKVTARRGGEVDLSSTENGAEIDKELRDYDLGIAIGIGTYYDPRGNITILLRVGDRTFGRPIPARSRWIPRRMSVAMQRPSRHASSAAARNG